jgi:hypothetical protein
MSQVIYGNKQQEAAALNTEHGHLKITYLTFALAISIKCLYLLTPETSHDLFTLASKSTHIHHPSFIMGEQWQ